ncbi:Piso0_000397 [Millerozyma farinosa CBS 7064]|uniref:Piso0_000397 protein n=1 Tax=Pichia sorbitophila (strain ATCC MYA-4447 / BCRC 22081 / CBS 7064 / NBRC 10061 / NRRL Y-12695) TaxID=559304 RepID=G8YTW3_PICSO|nr:Piso0_000397 [Millerozyma farinosa CBS 7064]CCE73364.1 Piso0_000397 [Millerozyma farinosa CBS 7064]
MSQGKEQSNEKMAEDSSSAKISGTDPVGGADRVCSNGFDRVLEDEQIKSMLKYRALQFHLSVILKIIKDPGFSGENTAEGRREIANMKLTGLRSGGREENEIVEEFVDRILFLMESDESAN